MIHSIETTPQVTISEQAARAIGDTALHEAGLFEMYYQDVLAVGDVDVVDLEDAELEAIIDGQLELGIKELN